jgi:uncharacterized membrane protein
MKRHAPALALDVGLVVVFCVIGRRSHDESSAILGLLGTVWPFLVGLGVGWLATIALYREKFTPELVLPTGILVWVTTVVVGMVLRAVSGQGTATSFIIVATTVLGVFLIGWRAVYRAIESRRTRAEASRAEASTTRGTSE